MSRSSRSSIKDRLKDVGIVAPDPTKSVDLSRDTSQTPKDNDLSFFLRRMRMPIGTELEGLEEPITHRRRTSTERRPESRLRREAVVSPPPKQYLYGSYKLADKRDEKKAAANRISQVEREMKAEMEAFYKQQQNARYKFDTQSLLNAFDDEEPVRRNTEAEKEEMMERRAKRCEKESFYHRPPNTRYKYRNDKLELTDDDENDEPSQDKVISRFLRKKSKEDRAQSREGPERPKSRFLRRRTEEPEESDDDNDSKEDDPNYYRFLFKHGAKYDGKAKVCRRKTPAEDQPAEESDEEDFFPRPALNSTRKKEESSKPELTANGRNKPAAFDSEDEEDLFPRPSPPKKTSYRPDEDHMNGNMNGRSNGYDLSDEDEPFSSFYHRPTIGKHDDPYLEIKQREQERREKERRNSLYNDVESLSADKIKEELMYFKNFKPKRSMERRFKKAPAPMLTNPAGYRMANKVNPLIESSLSFRPEKELTYRYGSYKLSDK